MVKRIFCDRCNEQDNSATSFKFEFIQRNHEPDSDDSMEKDLCRKCFYEVKDNLVKNLYRSY